MTRETIIICTVQMLVSLVRNEVSTGPIYEQKGKKVIIHWQMEVTSS